MHGLTASGAVVGVLSLLAIQAGAYRTAAIWMLVAFVIDSVDGTLARRVGVSWVVPRIDGRRLDDVVDFLNYVIVPAVFFMGTGTLSHWAWVAIPVLASAYGFSQVAAKTDDDFFLGFPSYWNIVALYAWLLDAGPAVTTPFVVGFSVAVFIPLKYAYPSKMASWKRLTTLLAALWAVALGLAVILHAGATSTTLTWASLAFVVYYFAISFYTGGVGRASG